MTPPTPTLPVHVPSVRGFHRFVANPRTRAAPRAVRTTSEAPFDAPAITHATDAANDGDDRNVAVFRPAKAVPLSAFHAKDDDDGFAQQWAL
mmetsp:Transcript_3955/g.14580  ORF Transcript_3955/g.14580 Transcript_3955/m.14580 type:complete len:92 (-) Transcript_3955:133-408(-)